MIQQRPFKFVAENFIRSSLLLAALLKEARKLDITPSNK
jgi:hypothetical protein